MNDQPDDTTQVTPAAQPDEVPTESKPLELAQWRRIAIITSSMFVATLALLGWQLSSGNDPGLSSQKFKSNRGPGGQGSGPPMNGPGAYGDGDGSQDGRQFQGGPPPRMGGQSQDGQQDGSQSGGPSTHSS
jgi:hypothetical protein